MKIRALLAVVGVVLGGLTLSRAFGDGGHGTSGIAGAPAAEPPLACDRTALSAEERTRHFEQLGPALLAARRSVRELPDGYELELPADAATLRLAAEWAAGERICCPFFDIELRLPSHGGPLWLRLTGKEGAKQVIESAGAAFLGR